MPAFERGMRRAARNSGAHYLDDSRLFHGHEDLRRRGRVEQQFVRDAGTLRPAADTGLCVTLAGPEEPLRLQRCAGAANQRFA
ncbi:hypothetical protein [Streptomyces silvensis]|uniref:Uncharacterized protein n=1 Tax=Streptomyces silvensis TaxID=1765722 RepID=A0A0W7WR13_9ACTN|nr:hypothetical protein [Streptomyces silvensis]KUF12997.1 hypothetical protein AT728_37260 [Streptomyces silvensis]